jgi:hypothetical protein
MLSVQGGRQGQEMTDEHRLTIGFPRMYNEPGERRAFLPPLIGLLGRRSRSMSRPGPGSKLLRRRLPRRV